MIRVDHTLHLARRFAGSLSRRPPAAEDEAWAVAQLQPAEQAAWWRLDVADRRHAIAVARRAVGRLPREATRAELAGFLLHDVGKADSGLGTFARVAATVWAGLAGVRAATGDGPLARYLRHEAIGAAQLARDGSDAVTVALVARSADAPPDALAALMAADDA